MNSPFGDMKILLLLLGLSSIAIATDVCAALIPPSSQLADVYIALITLSFQFASPISKQYDQRAESRAVAGWKRLLLWKLRRCLVQPAGIPQLLLGSALGIETRTNAAGLWNGQLDRRRRLDILNGGLHAAHRMHFTLHIECTEHYVCAAESEPLMYVLQAMCHNWNQVGGCF